MDEESSHPGSTQVDSLRRKRGHRRGQITRLQRRLNSLTAKSIQDISTFEADRLKTDLTHEIELHEALHEQIETLVLEDASAYEAEQAERDTRDDTHAALFAQADLLLDKTKVWQRGVELCTEAEAISALRDPSTDVFSDCCTQFAKSVRTFSGEAHLHKGDAAISTVLKSLKESDANFRLERERVGRAAPSTPISTDSATTPVRPSRPAPINVDLPKFDGDPTKWRRFEAMFLKAINTRAASYSDFDKRCLLSDALCSSEAKEIVETHGDKDSTMEHLLERLRKRFGSNRIVVPILVNKIAKTRSFANSRDGLRDLRTQYVQGFDSLKQLIGDSLSTFLLYSAWASLDEDLALDWESYLRSKSVDPTFQELSDYIDDRLENIRRTVPGSPTSKSTYATPTGQTTSYRPSSPSQPPKKQGPRKCPACHNDFHSLIRCSTFVGLTVDRRSKIIRDKKLCLNCLSDRHMVRNCSSKYSCRHCGDKHHSLLHKDNATEAVSSLNVGAEDDDKDGATNGPVPTFPNTITVTLENGGRKVRARAVLDSGAGVSLMTSSLAASLGLHRSPHHVMLTGSFNERSKSCVTTSLHSHDLVYSSPPIAFSIVSKMNPVPIPPSKKTILALPSLKNFTLADPELGGKVDMFIGNMDINKCAYEGALMFDGMKVLNTPFGWSIAGPLTNIASAQTLSTSAMPDSLQQDLALMWTLDQVPEAPGFSKEDDQVIKEFNAALQQDNGRFVVTLPRRQDPPALGDSRRQAVKRLLSNEKSLKAKDRLDAFNAVLREYLTLGHAQKIPKNDLLKTPHFYLPVHGVFKDSSSTTKVRAVFDASAKSSSGYSLNDTLVPGPNLYPILSDVIIRFRRHKVGMSADISKMFREVLLNRKEYDLHRFVMRDQDGSLVDCRMTRLTFGVNCSPFVATQVLHNIANLSVCSHPTASQAILNDFYVDDFLSGAETVQDADELRQSLYNILAQAGMTLRKWRTNSPELKERIPADLLETCPLSLPTPAQAPKALGVHWDTTTDSLHISTPTDLPESDVITKRVIASGTAGVFDVLGLFAPAIVPARILLQEAWKRSMTWDQPVPEDISDRWKVWVSDLPVITNLSIPRRFDSHDSPAVFRALHGFADASKVAYGAAIYLRTVHEDSTTSIALVVAKARVLPVKPVTIPKAELLGAHLLAKMLHHTLMLLNITLADTFAWTDSEIVLHWLAKQPSQLERFVANRVYAINNLVPHSNWRHVRSASNPADLASRGLRAPDLVTSELWWKGPPWLSLPPHLWPHGSLPRSNLVPLSVPCLSVQSQPDRPEEEARHEFTQQLWNRLSSFTSLSRITAWMLRFARNCRKPHDKIKSDVITSEEVAEAKQVLFRLSQLECYPEVFQAIKKSTTLPKGHALHKFTIQLSNNGHLLVNSRVRDHTNRTAPMQMIPLSPKSRLTKLLAATLHKVYSHAGPSALASILSNTYYVPNLRNMLKKVSRACPTCQRAYGKPLHHQMGLLPASRTTPAPPFDRTGVDYAGPFIIRQGYTRKPTLIKSYAALFVCLTTKAVHIELCSSLSTEDFMATFRRFVARRGCPSHVFSDNGTNFLGAREEIRELQRLLESKEARSAISTYAGDHGITWHNTPPRAPHFGGLWEAGVRTMKILLRKNIKPHPLRFDELATLLADTEAILNSRPLTPLHSDDVVEGTNLTAGHFLASRPLKAAPTPRASEAKISSLKRWSLVSRLTADLWKQWLTSYLATCSQRSKWSRPGHKLAPGEVVFIKDETLKIRDWPMAKITKIFPGDDGQVRAVQLKCRDKLYIRPACRIIPFIPEEEHSPKEPQSTKET